MDQDGQNVPYSYNVDPTNRARDGRSLQREDIGHVEENISNHCFSETNCEKATDLNTLPPALESKDAADKSQISSQRISQKDAEDSVEEDGSSVSSKEQIIKAAQISSQITTLSREVSKSVSQATDSTPNKETHIENTTSQQRRSRHYEEYLERQRIRKNKALDRERISNPYSFPKRRDLKSYKDQFINRNERHPLKETKK